MREKKEKIKEHFRRVDPTIFSLLAKMEFDLLEPTSPPEGYFLKLCRGIISQQLANKAAAAIVNRFTTAFAQGGITPECVLERSEEELRAVGMSYAKARYMKDLAAKTLAGEIRFEAFPGLSDEAVILELTKVKGIGRWTAEMFLIFTLGREDIFSFGDLGLKRAFTMLYGKHHAGTRKAMERVITPWSPYRSYASLALWESVDSP